MQRVFLNKKEFQDLIENECKNIKYSFVSDEKETDPELSGLRMFEYLGIQWIEKRELKE